MTDQGKQKLKYWLIGLFTGGVVAAPVTAFITKRVCDVQTEKAVAEAETRAMNDMAAYAVQQQMQQATEATVKVEGEVVKAPVVEEDIPEDEDINDYNVDIDDEEATEEARERTEAHERYLDMIDKYNGNDVIAPYIIDADKFITDQYMDKSYVNWYEEDNVFEEDLNTIDDPYYTFGVTDGAELFKNGQNRHDPDICYVRNERTTTDFEISRIHGSYAKMVGGEGSLGETDTEL